MGIEVNYARLAPAHYQALLDDAEAAEEFFYGEGLKESIAALHAGELPSPLTRRLRLGKGWDMMQFVYTGCSLLEPHDADTPLHFALQGAHDTPFECSYGTTRSLLPSEVLSAFRLWPRCPRVS